MAVPWYLAEHPLYHKEHGVAWLRPEQYVAVITGDCGNFVVKEHLNERLNTLSIEKKIEKASMQRLIEMVDRHRLGRFLLPAYHDHNGDTVPAFVIKPAPLAAFPGVRLLQRFDLDTVELVTNDLSLLKRVQLMPRLDSW